MSFCIFTKWWILQPSPQSILEHFCIPKRNSVHITSYFSFFSSSPSPNLRQPLIYFLSLWVYLFQTYHINGIIQSVIFYSWLFSFTIMFSRSIHVSAVPFYFQIQFHFVDVTDFIYSSIICIVFAFWLLCVILRISEYLCTGFNMGMLSILWGWNSLVRW